MNTIARKLYFGALSLSLCACTGQFAAKSGLQNTNSSRGIAASQTGSASTSGNAPAQTETPSASADVLQPISQAILFPTAVELAPIGNAYIDTIPDTLDLADRAQSFLEGVVNSHTTVQLFNNPAFTAFVPAGRAIFSPSSTNNGGENPNNLCGGNYPCVLDYDAGTANWGKLLTAAFDAQLMSGNNNSGTLSSLQTSANHMYGYLSIADFSEGGPAPVSNGLQALVFARQLFPNNQQLQPAIQGLVAWHNNAQKTQTIGADLWHYYCVNSSCTS